MYAEMMAIQLESGTTPRFLADLLLTQHPVKKRPGRTISDLHKTLTVAYILYKSRLPSPLSQQDFGPF